MSEPTVTREDSDRAWRFIGLHPAEADKLAREFAALRERADAEQRARRATMQALEERTRERDDAMNAAAVYERERDTAQRDAAAARADAERLRAIVADAEDLCLEIPLEGMAGSKVFPLAAALLKRINAEPAARTTESDDATAASAAPVGQHCETCSETAAHLDASPTTGNRYGCCGGPACCNSGWTIERLTAPTAQRKGT